MQVFVGLGNPGARYAETPHNAGFLVCDRFAARHRLPAPAEKFQGLFTRGKVLGHDVGVLKPQTYMNLSGDSVAQALRYLPVEPHELVVVFDEMDIPSGRLRLRKSGGHGGHNGLRSIIERIGSQVDPIDGEEWVFELVREGGPERNDMRTPPAPQQQAT